MTCPCRMHRKEDIFIQILVTHQPSRASQWNWVRVELSHWNGQEILQLLLKPNVRWRPAAYITVEPGLPSSHAHIKVKVKFSRYRPGVAQRVGRGIALLFHDRGTKRAWVVSSTPQSYFTSRKDPVPILQEAGWAPGPVWTGGKSRVHRESIPDRPARSQSLYRLSYRAHTS